MSFKDFKQISRHIDEYKKSVERMGNSIRTAHTATITFDDNIGESDCIDWVKSTAMKVSQTELNILLSGESGEFLRVGGTKPVKVQIRVIATTNQNLEKFLKNGNFRHDLYYRLCGIAIDIPPLRECFGDVAHLLAYFMQIYGRHEKYLDLKTLSALCNYSWPGNIRELRNIIRSLVCLSENRSILLSSLPERIRLTAGESRQPPAVMASSLTSRDPHTDNSLVLWEKQQIMQGFSKYGSSFLSKKLIAQEMGISISTLYNKIRLYSLSEKDKK